MIKTRNLSVSMYFNKCGKDCSVCREGGHGPYYKMVILENGKLSNLHIGKKLTLGTLVFDEVKERWTKLIK